MQVGKQDSNMFKHKKVDYVNKTYGDYTSDSLITKIIRFTLHWIVLINLYLILI